MNTKNLAPEDPDTYHAVVIVEDLYFSVFGSSLMLPKHDNRDALSWLRGALNHLCKTGSIRVVEVSYDA